MDRIYSADRERRLRLVLGVAVVVGALLLLLLLFVLLFGSGTYGAIAVIAVTGGAIAATGVWALRRLAARDRSARTSATVNGVVTLLSGLAFATTPETAILALGLIAVAVAVLALARLRDDPELT